jgi:hypothetical protein
MAEWTLDPYDQWGPRWEEYIDRNVIVVSEVGAHGKIPPAEPIYALQQWLRWDTVHGLKGITQRLRDLDLECAQRILRIWVGWPTLEGTKCKLTRSGWAKCIGGPVDGSGIPKRPNGIALAPPLGVKPSLERGTSQQQHDGSKTHRTTPPRTTTNQRIKDSQAMRTHDNNHPNKSGKSAKPKPCFWISLLKVSNNT